jgi:hypothetical protein
MKNRQTTEGLEGLFNRASQVREAWLALTECSNESFETQGKFWKNYTDSVKGYRRYYEDFAKSRLLEEDINVAKLIDAIIETGLLTPLALVNLHKTMDPACFFEPIVEPFKGMRI